MQVKTDAITQRQALNYPGPGEEAARFAAPGRVNLIGEHTDYSGGFVMPAAIDFHTIAAIRPRRDSKILIRSANFSDEVEYQADRLPNAGRHHWSDYPMGVVWSLSEQGIPFGGFELSITGDVPLGAGLSSSASITVACAFALLSLARAEMPLAKIALACQRAENGFVGAQSGIMDQFIACAGKRDHALMLDCRSLEYRLLPIPPNVRIVICNSMVKHSHAGGEYNQRRREVEEGTRVLRQRQPRIELLRDATEADLMASRAEMPENVFRRCRHIVTENKRVLLAAEALESGDLTSFGELMRQAQSSIRDDFQASCREIDLLVEIASELPGCYGARMTGGGFGGCTVNLVEEAQAANFRESIRKRYRTDTGIDADVYLCTASDGAGPFDE
ncbi:MAG TPA: galactokinase [Acidobacteriaceae bacterium]|jgi:galactokinase